MSGCHLLSAMHFDLESLQVKTTRSGQLAVPNMRPNRVWNPNFESQTFHLWKAFLSLNLNFSFKVETNLKQIFALIFQIENFNN